MHVLHLYDGHERVHSGRGSVPAVVWNVARETARRGHEVTVLERQWAGLDQVESHDGVAFRRLPLRTGSDEPWDRVPYEQVTSPTGVLRLLTDRAAFARAAWPHLRQIEFDVLHVHLPFAANVLSTLVPSLRSRTVYTAHLGEVRLDALTDDQQADEGGTSIHVPDFLRYFSPDVYLARRAAHTTVLNDRILDVFVDQGVDPDSVSVIPNGVDVDRFGDVPAAAVTDVRRKYGATGRPTLLFVGTIMPRKGVDDLVRAVGHLVTDRGLTDLRAVVAGEDELDGEYTAEVRGIVGDLGVEDNVTFPGFVPEEDLAPLYAAADAFVMPSREEGFGMTITEAMAAGTPVVGTRVGGIPRQVDDGHQGYLVEPNDPKGLANAIGDVLRDAPERRRMGESARERAETYSWGSIAERFERVYRSVGSRAERS
jgi:glycosyltransferase involved in cell wall biosynthesis